ncbi:Helix-turn-helix domain-containing protein [Rhizobiales bacterium GAS191]|nr:Helix-turn-helix domain-containing protein [Rhizobiales bacterium GAS191]
MLSLNSPGEVIRSVASRAKDRRLREGLTQQALADRSGVSFGSIKRFERTGEISLRGLVQVAFALGVQGDFEGLFQPIPFATLDEVLATPRKPMRGRRR